MPISETQKNVVISTAKPLVITTCVPTTVCLYKYGSSSPSTTAGPTSTVSSVTVVTSSLVGSPVMSTRTVPSDVTKQSSANILKPPVSSSLDHGGQTFHTQAQSPPPHTPAQASSSSETLRKPDELTHRDFSSIENSLKFLSGDLVNLKLDIAKSEERVKRLEISQGDINRLKADNVFLLRKIKELEDYSRRENIEITGLPEFKGENSYMVAVNFLRFKMQIPTPMQLVRYHRVGDGRNRPFLLRFKNYEDKLTVIKRKSILKGTGIFINDDLCEESQRERSNLIPVLKELQKKNKRAHFRGAKIYHNGRLFGENNVYDLPINMQDVCTRSGYGITAFAGKWSLFSNLNLILKGVVIDKEIWPSTEHFYQVQKALHVGDLDKAFMIASTTDPVQAMKIGGTIDTSGSDWDTVSRAIMKRAVAAKFEIPAYRRALLNANSVFVEATHNPTWGAGCKLADSKVFHPEDWRGKNAMGEILAEIRAEAIQKDRMTTPS